MTTLWNLTPPIARFASQHLAATINLRLPQAGLCVAPGCQILGVKPQASGPLEPIDFYQRGADLVVTYPDSPAFPLKVQSDWRAVPSDQLPPRAHGFDLHISVQTPLLDACPKVLAITSILAESGVCLMSDPADGFFRLEQQRSPQPRPSQPIACTLVRTKALADCSYVEMIHPDVDRKDVADWEDAGSAWRLGLSRTLFAENLEKGVILRAWLRGVIAPREDDEALALAAYAAFIDAPLPLTT